MTDFDFSQYRTEWPLGPAEDDALPTAAVLEQMTSEALRVRLNAHASQSKFLVGAALLTTTGEIFTGCNVEASNGTSICAERAALAKAISEGYTSFAAVAAVGDTEAPITPCGQCRQQLSDFDQNILVVMMTTRSPVLEVARLAQLFPRANFKTGSGAVYA